ncbi:MAG: hypothetical protein K2V38_03850 [Gemmataceae bacterium]|nr:hypothetical protein [Gemmataceae bacterium]
MTARELNIGDIFRVVGDKRLWRKDSATAAKPSGRPFVRATDLSAFTGKQIVVVDRADTSAIRRSENTLILRDGEVTLRHTGLWVVHSHTPGDPLTEVTLVADTFGASRVKVPTENTAIGFAVGTGAKEFGRPKGSEVFAYKGRVYARATNAEVAAVKGTTARASTGGYKRLRTIDGKPRLIFAGLLNIPGEFALYDIIQEHFGPDTVTPPPDSPESRE